MNGFWADRYTRSELMPILFVIFEGKLYPRLMDLILIKRTVAVRQGGYAQSIPACIRLREFIRGIIRCPVIHFILIHAAVHKERMTGRAAVGTVGYVTTTGLPDTSERHDIQIKILIGKTVVEPKYKSPAGNCRSPGGLSAPMVPLPSTSSILISPGSSPVPVGFSAFSPSCHMPVFFYIINYRQRLLLHTSRCRCLASASGWRATMLFPAMEKVPRSCSSANPPGLFVFQSC